MQHVYEKLEIYANVFFLCLILMTNYRRVMIIHVLNVHTLCSHVACMIIFCAQNPSENWIHACEENHMIYSYRTYIVHEYPLMIANLNVSRLVGVYCCCLIVNMDEELSSPPPPLRITGHMIRGIKGRHACGDFFV